MKRLGGIRAILEHPGYGIELNGDMWWLYVEAPGGGWDFIGGVQRLEWASIQIADFEDLKGTRR